MLGRLAGVVVIVVALGFAGGLADPTPQGFVTFSTIERNHFTAFSVWREHAPPSPRETGYVRDVWEVVQPLPPLVLRVNVIGDAAPAAIAPESTALSQVAAYLQRELNVVLVADPMGAPLYLTRENLVATSGPASLGATLSTGMAAEVGNPRVAGCVIAHEMGHFLGLHHVDDAQDLMYPRCTEEKLSTATLGPDARRKVDHLVAIRALTTDGFVTWASRG